MMAVIGEIALLAVASGLIVAGIFGALIGCAMDSSGSLKHLWILLAAVVGVALGAAAIHYGPITIQIRANQGSANGN